MKFLKIWALALLLSTASVCSLAVKRLQTTTRGAVVGHYRLGRSSGGSSRTRIDAATDDRLIDTKEGGRPDSSGDGISESRGTAARKSKGLNVKKPTRFIHPQVFKMFQRAQHCMRNGENVVAQRLLYRCLELNPYDSHSWLALAQLEGKLGNIDRARDLFVQGVAKCPNNVYILHAWGHLEQKYGNETAARDCWSQAVALDPLNAYVCHALSNLEKRLRNFDRAREILELVVDKKPTSAICVSLADLERQEGHPERAREILQHGLAKCNKERSKIMLALAWLEEDAFDKSTEAKQLIDQALLIDGQNVRIYVAKANMEMRMKNIDQARNTLKMATKLHAEDGQHYTMWSTLEFEADRHLEARRILEDGAAKFPGDYFLLQRWGTLEAKLGNSTKAKELFERSVMIQPHAPTFVAWGILEEDIGAVALLQVNSPSSSFLHLKNQKENNKDVISNSVDPILTKMFLNDQNAESKIISKKEFSGLMSDVPLLTANPTLESKKFADMQFKKARHLLSLGMIVDPQHGPLYHAYGNMELRHGNITGARDVFMMGIAGNASDITSLYHAWGMLELKGGRREEAGDIFRRGIELGLKGNREVDNGVGFLLHSLGTLEADNNRPDEAKRVFSTGVNLFPKHSHLLLGLALASMRLGEYDKAREFFKESVDADPFHAHAWQSWAISEKQCGNIELARILFKQGLKKSPGHGALWQASAVMEMQQGNIDVARTLFAQSLNRCPLHAQSYQAWACLEVRMGNLIKAKALALQGIRSCPRHPALWTVAGLVEDRLGEHDKARTLLETGIERFPNHGALYKVLGEKYEREGDIVKARQVFAEGLDKDPLCAPVYHAAALLEASIGNLVGLSAMHAKATSNLVSQSSQRSSSEIDIDIIERIALIELELQASGGISSDHALSDL